MRLSLDVEVESELEGNNNRCSALEEAQRGNATLQEVKEVQDDITRFWCASGPIRLFALDSTRIRDLK